jgi:twinkle protein
MRPKDQSETEYIGTCLRKLRKFARKNNICIFVVVHPRIMHREKGGPVSPVPTPYDIAGSANWYNKADNLLIVYRDFEADKTTVYIKKVKFRNYGELGEVDFWFDKKSGRYSEEPFTGTEVPTVVV